ncbi:MAG: hypothetical protein AAGE52_23070 [Myxococcota bacterium]
MQSRFGDTLREFRERVKTGRRNSDDWLPLARVMERCAEDLTAEEAQELAPWLQIANAAATYLHAKELPLSAIAALLDHWKTATAPASWVALVLETTGRAEDLGAAWADALSYLHVRHNESNAAVALTKMCRTRPHLAKALQSLTRRRIATPTDMAVLARLGSEDATRPLQELLQSAPDDALVASLWSAVKGVVPVHESAVRVFRAIRMAARARLEGTALGELHASLGLEVPLEMLFFSLHLRGDAVRAYNEELIDGKGMYLSVLLASHRAEWFTFEVHSPDDYRPTRLVTNDRVETLPWLERFAMSQPSLATLPAWIREFQETQEVTWSRPRPAKDSLAETLRKWLRLDTLAYESRLIEP